MKIIIHKAEERGHADHGWLKSYHSFSFAGYYNPLKERFGLLRVLNDDSVAGGQGFGTHPHENMEIVSIPLEGALEHKDNMGTHSIIKKDDVQIMSAGTGISHSEFNHSKTETVKFLQLWIFPKEKNIKPRYDQKTFSVSDRHNKFQLVVSPEKNEKSIWINQDAFLSLGRFQKDHVTEYILHKKGNGIYFFILHGTVEIENQKLNSRDAIGITEAEKINIKTSIDSEILAIEVPMN